MASFKKSTNNHHQKRQFQDLPLGYEISLYFGEEGGSVTVTQGSATSFGAPLRSGHTYTLVNQGIPVATTAGCRLDILGASKVGKAGPMDCSIHELHAVLHRDRQAAAASPTLGGPRVLVVGNTDTGKSSLCRSLVNLGFSTSSLKAGAGGGDQAGATSVGAPRSIDEREAAGANKNGVGISYIDVDLGQTALSVPGTVSTVFLSDGVGPIESFTQSNMPLTFFFGEAALRHHQDMSRYLDLIANTKQSIDSFEATKPDFRAGGTIINTMGWVEGMGYKAIEGIMDICRVTHVVVTGGDADLFDRCQRTVQQNVSMRETKVIHYRSHKGGKTFVRTSSVRREARRRMISDYFTGTPQQPLVCPRLTLKLKDCAFLDATTFAEYEFPPVLALCAVSTATDFEHIPHANAAGFVIVTDVGEETVSILSPSSGALPSKVFLVSSTIALKEEDIPPVTNM